MMNMIEGDEINSEGNEMTMTIGDHLHEDTGINNVDVAIVTHILGIEVQRGNIMGAMVGTKVPTGIVGTVMVVAVAVGAVAETVHHSRNLNASGRTMINHGRHQTLQCLVKKLLPVSPC